MKTITINGWIHCKPADSWNEQQVDGLEYDFFIHEDMTICGRAMVTPYTMTFDLPEGFNPNGTFVNALEEKKKELQAEFQKRITQIQAEINKLTAISYEVEV
jgi:hypothetical protein